LLRILANWAAKKYYVFNQEFQAKTADLHAGLSLKLAAEKRALVEKLSKEADDIEASIKAVDEKLAAGYWECENGHEFIGGSIFRTINGVGPNKLAPAVEAQVCPAAPAPLANKPDPVPSTK
jgi:hypothetical protein